MSEKKYTPEELKSMIEDEEIDLSLNRLTTVPTAELAKVTKRYISLDLSLNELIRLPQDFSKSLRHLVRLDLSKNHITVLPDDIGLLESLKHFDLYRNKLTVIPLSFGRLNALQWLDLKDNPLSDELAKATGECLNDEQCKKCAVNLVKHMKMVQSVKDREMDLQRQKDKERQRKKDQQIKKQELAEKERLKRQKKEDKELRRRKWKEEHPDEGDNQTDEDSVEVNEESVQHATTKKSKKRKASCCWVLLAVVVVIVGSGISMFNLYCRNNSKAETCVQSKRFLSKCQNNTKEFIGEVGNQSERLWTAGKPKVMATVGSLSYYCDKMVDFLWPYIGSVCIAVEPYFTKAFDYVCSFITNTAMQV